MNKASVMDTASCDRPEPMASNAVPASSIGLGLTLIMAIACGMSVANIYYNQPMLGIIGSTFPSQRAVTGFVPTATQLGYAAGLLLLVPLGDRIERRRLIMMQFAALVLSLAVVALAPDAWSLLIASALVGVSSSVAQQILPFAAELSAPHRRGATIGIVMSGLLCGILFGRALAGAVAVHYGWRAMFWLGLLMVISIALVLAVALPKSQPKTRASYGELLRSLATLWREEPQLRRATMIQACLFGSFSTLWTTLALQLDSHYHLGADVAGLFGIIGAVGVLFAPIAGKIADRRGPHFVIGLACVTMVASWVVFDIWGMVAGLIVGVILLDFGAQGAQVSNQHVIQALRPEARNRLNATLMSGMFVGGALGSAGASVAWDFAGWTAVCALGAVFAAMALSAHVRGRRSAGPAY
ncbi:MFS transporter [Ralstonia pseudosolanacearum]|uniref:MFS transporter n=1 Tax=Ralstonia pseudosolanacearum TaxID=1310165 RepID=UPI001E2DDBE9|nr:MFS transporter [Ralstonia pseudosolanacearum]